MSSIYTAGSPNQVQQAREFGQRSATLSDDWEIFPLLILVGGAATLFTLVGTGDISYGTEAIGGGVACMVFGGMIFHCLMEKQARRRGKWKRLTQVQIAGINKGLFTDLPTLTHMIYDNKTATHDRNGVLYDHSKTRCPHGTIAQLDLTGLDDNLKEKLKEMSAQYQKELLDLWDKYTELEELNNLAHYPDNIHSSFQDLADIVRDKRQYILSLNLLEANTSKIRNSMTYRLKPVDCFTA